MREFSVKTETGLDNIHGYGFICHPYLQQKGTTKNFRYRLDYIFKTALKIYSKL